MAIGGARTSAGRCIWGVDATHRRVSVAHLHTNPLSVANVRTLLVAILLAAFAVPDAAADSPLSISTAATYDFVGHMDVNSTTPYLYRITDTDIWNVTGVPLDNDTYAAVPGPDSIVRVLPSSALLSELVRHNVSMMMSVETNTTVANLTTSDTRYNISNSTAKPWQWQQQQWRHEQGLEVSQDEPNVEEASSAAAAAPPGVRMVVLEVNDTMEWWGATSIEADRQGGILRVHRILLSPLSNGTTSNSSSAAPRTHSLRNMTLAVSTAYGKEPILVSSLLLHDQGIRNSLMEAFHFLAR